MPKILVVHRAYGCETGCCGHAIEIDGEETAFEFTHPDYREDFLDFAKEFVSDQCGTEHVADLDWENSRVVDI